MGLDGDPPTAPPVSQEPSFSRDTHRRYGRWLPPRMFDGTGEASSFPSQEFHQRLGAPSRLCMASLCHMATGSGDARCLFCGKFNCVINVRHAIK
jgi:hypothetical protein